MINMTKVLYPGSFDPFTNGHLHVIKTSASLFDKVYVDLGINSAKTRHYDANLMKKAMEEVFMEDGIDNVEVVIYDGATIDLAEELGVDMIIRGIRDSIDLAEEERAAALNYDYSGIDTMYVRAGDFGNISSSVVRELLKYNKDITKYVPTPVKRLIYEEGK